MKMIIVKASTSSIPRVLPAPLPICKGRGMLPAVVDLRPGLLMGQVNFLVDSSERLLV